MFLAVEKGRDAQADCLPREGSNGPGSGPVGRATGTSGEQRVEPRLARALAAGPTLTGIGICLAFPTLGSAAVRDVAVDRFATASAVNAAFRQIGAVLGTALLVAIVGDPATLADALALAVSDSAYLFAAIAALLSGAVTLMLRPAPTAVESGSPRSPDRRDAASTYLPIAGPARDA